MAVPCHPPRRACSCQAWTRLLLEDVKLGVRGGQSSHDMIFCKIWQQHALRAKMWVGGGAGMVAATLCKKVSEFP